MKIASVQHQPQVKGCPLREKALDARAVQGSLAQWAVYQEKAIEDKLSIHSDNGLLFTPKSEVVNPLVILPGWTTTNEALRPLVSQLTAANGSQGPAAFVQDGKLFADAECTQSLDGQAAKEAKVFVVNYTDRRAGIEETLPQAEKAVKKLLELHPEQAGKVDLMGYSLGGIVARKLLDDQAASEQSSPFGKVALVGTPNHGNNLAVNASRILEREIGWAMKLGGSKPTDLNAIQWMMPDSPKLDDLNRRIDQQLGAAEKVLNLGVNGVATLNEHNLLEKNGDGLISFESVRLDRLGVDLELKPGAELFHPVLTESPKVYQELGEFFGWKPVDETPKHIGHRGCTFAPENTLAAFKEAVSRGAEAVEFDVHCTKDGELIVMHDDTLERTTNGAGRITEKTLAELRELDAGSWFDPKFAGEKLPTLDEALRFCQDNQIQAFIEIKEGPRSPEFTQKLFASIDRHQMAEQSQVISFDHAFVEQVERQRPQLRTGALISEKPMLNAVKGGIQAGALAGAALGAGLTALHTTGWMGGLAVAAAGLIGGALIGRLQGRERLQDQINQQQGKVDKALPFCWGVDPWMVRDAKEKGLEIIPYTGPITQNSRLMNNAYLAYGCQGVISNIMN